MGCCLIHELLKKSIWSLIYLVGFCFLTPLIKKFCILEPWQRIYLQTLQYSSHPKFGCENLSSEVSLCSPEPKATYKGLCVAAQRAQGERARVLHSEEPPHFYWLCRVSLSVKFYMWKCFGYKCLKLGIKEQSSSWCLGREHGNTAWDITLLYISLLYLRNITDQWEYMNLQSGDSFYINSVTVEFVPTCELSPWWG